MKHSSIPYLLVIIFSTLFQLFFCGLYSIYTIYFLPYYEDKYEWFAYASRTVPTRTELLFSGFHSGYLIMEALVIALLQALLAKKLHIFVQYKDRFWQIVYTSFSLTILFAALYFISGFIWYKTITQLSTSFTLGVLQKQLPFVIALYLILAVPAAAVSHKKFTSWTRPQ